MTWARVFFTVCVFVSFVTVLLIAFNRRNKVNYDDAARSIVDDPDTPDTESDRENGA